MIYAFIFGVLALIAVDPAFGSGAHIHSDYEQRLKALEQRLADPAPKPDPTPSPPPPVPDPVPDPDPPPAAGDIPAGFALVLRRPFDTPPPVCSACDEGVFLNRGAAGAVPTIEDGWLTFRVPSRTGAGAGGQYFVKFRDREVGPGGALYVRWRQKFNAGFLQSSRAGGGAKLALIGDADQNSCASNEIVIQNTYSRDIVQAYHSCREFRGFEVKQKQAPFGIDLQPGGDNACWYGRTDDPDCFKLIAGADYVFEVRIDVNADPAAESRVRIWVTRTGRARTLVIDYRRVLVDAEKGFGAVWLTPYNGNKNPAAAHPEAIIAYRDLVIATGPADLGDSEPPPVPDNGPPPADDTGSGDSETGDTAAARATARTVRTLADCKAILTARGGGWCEMKVSGARPGISAVWPTAFPRYVHAVEGPRAVLDDWTGAAWAPRCKVWFTGGGHGAYGGNEIYQFDYCAGIWSRLTDPSPLDYVYRQGDDTNFAYWFTVDPRTEPPSNHTYDGILFDRGRRTILVFPTQACNCGPIGYKPTAAELTPIDQGGRFAGPLGALGGAYEFNPSPTEARAGLAPLAWRKVWDGPSDYSRTVQLPDGAILAGGYDRLHRFAWQGDRLVVQSTFARWAGYGDGLAAYDPVRDWVWVIGARILDAFDRQGRVVHRYNTQAEYNAGTMKPMPRGKSIAFGADGRLYHWDGFKTVHTYEPAGKQWKPVAFDAPSAELPYADGGVNSVYSRFAHIGDNFFAGYGTHKTGFWIFLPPMENR